MSGFGFGTQSDWYAVGMLLMQLAFLVAGLWFARNFLKTVRGFQEQVGALVKLSMSGAPEQHAARTIARRTLGDTSTNWRTPEEAQPVDAEERAEIATPRVEPRTYRLPRVEVSTASVLGPSMAQTTEAAAGTHVGAWRRMGFWLQTPLHVSEANPDATGLRRVMQWLGAPAGS
jgi:hypothetical protein